MAAATEEAGGITLNHLNHKVLNNVLSKNTDNDMAAASTRAGGPTHQLSHSKHEGRRPNAPAEPFRVLLLVTYYVQKGKNN